LKLNAKELMPSPYPFPEDMKDCKTKRNHY